MGKAKKRQFIKAKYDTVMNLTREQGIETIIHALKTGTLTPEILNIIDLFGITKEELTEYNIKYEDLKVLYPVL